MAVEDEICEQQPALMSRQVTFDALAVALDGESAADLDPSRCLGPPRRHANIFAVPLARNQDLEGCHGEDDPLRVRLRGPGRH